MNRAATLIGVLLATVPAAAWAQGERDPAAYDRCLAEAAIRVSYTDVRDSDVFDLARRRCASTRAAVAKAPQMLAMLDAADATKAANFPDWIGRLRERRQLRAIGLPISADPGYR